MVSQADGIHNQVFSVIDQMPARTVRDYDNIIARLVRRKQIARWEDGACHPGPRFPSRNPNSKWLAKPIKANGHANHGGLF